MASPKRFYKNSTPMMANVLGEIVSKAEVAKMRYGRIASTHEGLGVITEEYQELIDAVRLNDLEQVAKEATDIAAICMRLAEACLDGSIAERSTK